MLKQMRILIIEDEHKIANSIKKGLEQESYAVDVCYTGNEGFDLAVVEEYDIIVLDLFLPGMDGLILCKKLRHEKIHTPILMLTGKESVQEKEQGLDSGADDYLTKPFDVRELGARVRALLRRTGTFTPECLNFGILSIDVKARSVTLNGATIDLAPKEFALLEFFLRHPNQVFNPDALLDRVWKSESDSTVDSVRVYINRLRSKLGSPKGAPSITTVFGVGYKMAWTPGDEES